MANNAKLQLIPDIAWGEFGVIREKGKIKDECGLGFEDYSEVLAEVALNTPGPFTIGVFGNWGTGKSSLMRRVMTRVEEEKNVVPVWFNAWQFERDENPVVPLIATIVATLLEEKSKGKKIAEGLVKALRVVAYGLSLKANVDLKVISGEIAFSPKDMIDHLGELSDPLLDRSLFYNAFKLLNEASKNADGSRVIVFIDDLDRCLLDKALMMLEYIKLVLAQPGFIFVLGLDDRVISGYLDKRFKEDFKVADFKGREYLRKLVQLSFPIPPHGKRIETFARSCVKRIESQLSKDEKSALTDIIPIFGLACKSNPRAVIRYINNLLVDRAIASRDEKLNRIPLGMFAISRALQENWSEFFELVQKLDNGDSLLRFIIDSPTQVDIAIAESDGVRRKELTLYQGIQNDEELIKLLNSVPGHLYLKEDDLRKACVDFLIITRNVEEELSGDEQMYSPSSQLAAVIGEGTFTRVEITKRLWAYIKKHRLQDGFNRRQINCDEKLKELYERDSVSLFEMNRLISNHIYGIDV